MFYPPSSSLGGESSTDLPSSTDATLNNSLLDARSPDGGCTTEASSYSTHALVSKFSFSSFAGKHQKSSSCDARSPCCGQTAAETVESSNWSLTGGVAEDTREAAPSNGLADCLFCFWPTAQGVTGRPHGDCFVAVDGSAGLDDSNYWRTTYVDTPLLSRIEERDDDQPPPAAFTPLTKEILSLPRRHSAQLRQITVDDENACQIKLARLTPVTLHSNSFTVHGNTFASTMNTLHRRTDDISMGFFTARTLDIIHTSPSKLNEAAGTPRKEDHRLSIDNNKSAFHTPGRQRVDSETFRRTMTVVTCEKRKAHSYSLDDSEVSLLDSDVGFSPMIESRTRDRADSLPPRQTPMTAQKKLPFDVGSVRRYDTVNATHNYTPGTAVPGRNLLHNFATPEPIDEHVSPLSEFGMNVMKSLQSIVQGKQSVALHPGASEYEADKENVTGNAPSIVPSLLPSTYGSDGDRLWQEGFLQKSSSFLKALRRTGRKGKVLVQGWVAFRETVPWKEIFRNPKRRDFRYLVLLDDMPLLHLFCARPKPKKLAPKHDPLQDCISLDLTGDVAVKVALVSKEFGNEVSLFDEEGERYRYGMLPVPMPSRVFCDKHRSRLAKGGPLKGVFEPFQRSVTFATRDAGTETPQDLPATMQQYDVSRHLFFVLDCAIKFPLNHPGRPLQVNITT